MSKVWIIYHNEDIDGQSSAAIAYKYVFEHIIDNNHKDIGLIPMSYGDLFDFSQIDMNNDLVIFVDFVLQPFDQMLIFDVENLIIIDHHKTTIENLEKNPDFKPDGLIGDLNNKMSAAELAWKFFFPNITVPMFIQYISLYDTWQKDSMDSQMWNQIMGFNEGIKASLGNFDQDKISWLDIINWSISDQNSEEFKAYVSWMLETQRWGNFILKQKIQTNNDIIAKNSFVTEFQSYKVLALNRDMANFMTDSPTWKEDGKFDIAICFAWNGGKQNRYTVHMRTDKKEIDLSMLAKKFKGGGHSASSGFQAKNLPFKLG